MLSVSSQWPSAQEADGVSSLSPALLQAYHDMLVNRPTGYGDEDPITCVVTRHYGRWSAERWRSHFTGAEPLALDGMNRLGKAKWLCFGSDAAHDVAPLHEIQAFLQVLGVASILESQPYDPMLWVFLETPLPVVPVHAFGAVVIDYLSGRPGSTVHEEDIYAGPDFMDDFPAIEGMFPAPLLPDPFTGCLPRCYSAQDVSIETECVPELVSWWVQQPRLSVTQMATAFHLLYLYEGSPQDECHTFMQWLHGHAPRLFAALRPPSRR